MPACTRSWIEGEGSAFGPLGGPGPRACPALMTSLPQLKGTNPAGSARNWTSSTCIRHERCACCEPAVGSHIAALGMPPGELLGGKWRGEPTTGN